MWVVTTDAPHSVARFFLAAALRQGLHLTDCAQSCTLPRTLPTNQHKIADVVRERRSRTKLVNVAPRALNGNLALEMALHAHLVAPRRAQLRRIHNCPGLLSEGFDMRLAGSVTVLTADGQLLKSGVGVSARPVS